MAFYYMYPNAINTDAAGFTAVGAATKPDCIDDPYGANDEDATYLNVATNAYILFEMTSMVDAVRINSVTLNVRHGFTGTISGQQLHSSIVSNGVTTFTALRNVSGSYTTFSDSWTLNPSTGAAWTVSELNAIVCGLDFVTAGDGDHITQMLIVVDYVAVPRGISQAREVGSRVLHVTRKPTDLVNFAAPLSVGHADLLSLLPMTHPLGSSADGKGWGDRPRQRRPTILLGKTIDPNTYMVTGKALDARSSIQLYRLWMTMRTKDPFSTAIQGVAQSDVGALVSYSRLGKAWVLNSDGRIVSVPDSVQKFQRDGGYFEPARTNAQPRSSFKNGTTGLTLTAGSGTVAVDATDLLFDVLETPNSLKFTAGSPNTTGPVAQWPNTDSYTAGKVVTVSVDYSGDVGTVFSVKILRNFDSVGWDDTSATFSGTPFNSLPTCDGTRQRWESKPINVGANATTLAVFLKTPDGGTAARVNHVFHVQVEEGWWASSRILTEAAAVTRAADALTLTTNNQPHVFPLERGTFWFSFVPDWSTAKLGASGQNMNFLRADYNAAQSEAMSFNANAGEFRWTRMFNGVNARARSVQTVTRGTKMAIAGRWTSAEGELGLPVYTVSVFVNGVKGTDDVGTGQPIPSAAVALQIGHSSGALNAGGLMGDLHITDQVLTDEEIADVSAGLLL